MSNKKYNYKTDGNPIDLLPTLSGGYAFGTSDEGPKIDTLLTQKLAYSDLFTLDAEGNAESTKIVTILDKNAMYYKKLLMYVDSSYPIEFLVRVFDRVEGIYQMATWDGESFKARERADSVIVPSVSELNASHQTARFPIHHAIRFLNDGR